MKSGISVNSFHATTHQGFVYWASRDYLSPFTRDALLNATIVLIPHENFGDQALAVFPVNTAEFFRDLRESAPHGVTVEIAAENSDYREVALHSELMRLATILVKSIAAPIVVSLVSEFLKKRLGTRVSKSEVEMSLIVEEDSPECQRQLKFDYKGPAALFEQMLNSKVSEAFSKKNKLKQNDAQ